MGIFNLKSLMAGLSMIAAASIAAIPSPAAAAAKGAAIVIDANTGKTLYSDAADASRFPASLTKMMTLYMVFERMQQGKLTKNTRMRVSAKAAAASPSKLGLRAGKTITVEDAILGLVTKSANDAAIVVAEHIGGNEADFARMMTRKARALGMSATNFRNASGLPDVRQVTTARDMARLGIALREHHPRYYGYFKTRSFTYAGRRHGNHNKLLGNVEGVDGIKTGYIRASGFNLVTSVRSDGRSIVAVVMGGQTGGKRDARMRGLVAKFLPKASRREGGDLIAKAPVEAAPANGSSKAVVAAAAGVKLPKGAVAPVPEGRPAVTAYAEEAVREPSPAVAAIDETITASVSKPAEGWMVQIAAADSREGASKLLDAARAKVGKALGGASDHVEQTEKNGQTLHRARFAGFASKSAANTACNALKKQKISCFAIEG
jgi:D-alanyl-D-alanine carboxypeptidase